MVLVETHQQETSSANGHLHVVRYMCEEKFAQISGQQTTATNMFFHFMVSSKCQDIKTFMSQATKNCDRLIVVASDVRNVRSAL